MDLGTLSLQKDLFGIENSADKEQAGAELCQTQPQLDLGF